MSITIGTEAVGSATANSLTYSHNNNVVDDNCLIVYVHSTIGGRFTPQVPSGITYNGAAMTIAMSGGSPKPGGSIWYLVNADSGVNDIVITMNAGTGKKIVAHSISLNNVHQTNPIGDTDSVSGTGDSKSASLIGMRTDVLVIDFCQTANQGNLTHTLGTGQSAFASGSQNYEIPAGLDYDSTHSYKQVSDGGSTTMSRSYSATPDYGSSLGAIEIRSVDSAIPISITEDIEVAEQASKDRQKNFTESVEITETKAVGFIFFKNIVESLRITETIQKTFTKIIEESVKITETLVRIREKIFSEGIKLTETVSPSFKYIKSIVESIEVSTWLRNVLNGFRVGFWTKQDKTSATFTAEEKESTTWTEEGKKTATWTPQDKKLNE